MSTEREHFSNKVGFILAAAGSAVGLGNLVAFPVAASKGGGGAFLVLYVFFVVFICLPIMLAEINLGRKAQSDPQGAYPAIAGSKSKWRFAGWLAVITPFMIGVFYMVLTVWILGYFLLTITGNLASLANPAYFDSFVNHYSIFFYLLIVAALVHIILVGGVQKGIERASRLLMPALFIMLVGLAIFVLTMDNAFTGARFFLIPDFSKVNGDVISGALSQAFFSLSLGMGILITFGSYLRRSDDLVNSTKWVAVTDSCVAFVAGLMILPAIFVFDPEINPDTLSESSVTLVFTFLPQIFLALQETIGYFAASVVAAVFFLLVFLAALTSLVSIIEVPTATIVRKYNVNRSRALSYLAMTMGVLTLIAIASFGMLAMFTEMVSYGGSTRSFFDVIYDLFYDTILPLNGLLICLFVVWRWKRGPFHEALAQGNDSYAQSWLKRYISFSLTTFIPVILAIVFINTVASIYFGSAFF